MKRTLTFAVMILLLGFGSAAAYADTIDFTLGNSAQNIASRPGGTLTYTATVSAPAGNGADVYLNGDSFNIDFPLTLDDTDFFVNFPFTLSPGGSFTGDLFTLTIPGGTAVGTYNGTFTLLGGADGSADDTLGTVSYSVTVTPEPSNLLLLGTGLTGIITLLKRKSFSAV